MKRVNEAFAIPKTNENTKRSKQKRKMNKYEKSIYRPIKIISILTVVLMISNMVISPIQGVRGYKSPFQYAMLIVYFVTMLNSRGFNINYDFPLGWALGIRFTEIIFHFFPYTTPLNYTFLFMLLFLDTIYFSLVAYHKYNYEFEVEKYDN